MTTRTVIEAKLAAIDLRKATTLQALQRQRSKLKARLAEFDRPTKSQRRLDARRKILLGAFVLETMQHAGIAPQAVNFEGQHFFDWLIRPTDRALFGDDPRVFGPTSPPQVSPPPVVAVDTPMNSRHGDESRRGAPADKSKRCAKPRALANGQTKPRRKSKSPDCLEC